MPKVTLKLNDEVIREIPIGRGRITIGRKKENDIKIDSPEASGIHAKLYNFGGHFFIQDLNSLNGTFVNGKKIEKHRLRNGDEILIGQYTLHFSAGIGTLEVTQELRQLPTGEPILFDVYKRDRISGQSLAHKSSMDCAAGFVVIDGVSEQKEYPLKNDLTIIGKSDKADIRIKGFFSSKKAALIRKKTDGYLLIPAEDKNAVKINKQILKNQLQLKDGDIIETGGLKLMFFVKN